ncbi:MAG: YigZ family protein [Candidatus Cloacimonetes bacterium]|nr:YigZ family protein [Candidatus Cloacimonadota bacterium]
MKDFYHLKKENITEIKIKRSLFISHLQNVRSIDEAKKYISKISHKEKNANHNCWAYIIGNKAEIYHSSDAGEPSGTAGKPMLNALMKHNLTNTVAVVTRYFGGVKLGVRGLIEAYSQSVECTIQSSKIEQLIEIENIKFIISYDFFNKLKYQLECSNVKFIEIIYEAKITIEIEVPKEIFLETMNLLGEYEKQNLVTIQTESY